jgi:hypothetical protein
VEDNCKHAKLDISLPDLGHFSSLNSKPHYYFSKQICDIPFAAELLRLPTEILMSL